MVDISGLLNNYSQFRSGRITTAPAGEKNVIPRGKTERTANFTAVSMEFRLEITGVSSTGFKDQAVIFSRSISNEVDLSSLYSKEIPLSVEEAKGLVAEDGFYGVNKTSQRIADFVINGAGDDLEKLRQGREGMLRGFGEAEKAWGGELPSISHETLQEALSMVDERIGDLGGSIVDTTG